jgi:Zn-dependent protease with chaperone function
MIDKKSQSRLLSVTFWVILISWLIIPISMLTSHVSYYLGNGIISLISLITFILSGVGLVKKNTFTRWFVLSIILSVLTLLYSISNIKLPVQT